MTMQDPVIITNDAEWKRLKGLRDEIDAAMSDAVTYGQISGAEGRSVQFYGLIDMQKQRDRLTVQMNRRAAEITGVDWDWGQSVDLSFPVR